MDMYTTLYLDYLVRGRRKSWEAIFGRWFARVIIQ